MVNLEQWYIDSKSNKELEIISLGKVVHETDLAILYQGFYMNGVYSIKNPGIGREKIQVWIPKIAIIKKENK